VALELKYLVECYIQTWREKATEFCPQIENPRKADLVQRNLTSVQNALKEREKRYGLQMCRSLERFPYLCIYPRHGATVEQMTVEVNKAKANLDTAEKDLKNMSTLNKVLSEHRRHPQQPILLSF
jgi:structural maintenance of chromosomes protein 6